MEKLCRDKLFSNISKSSLTLNIFKLRNISIRGSREPRRVHGHAPYVVHGQIKPERDFIKTFENKNKMFYVYVLQSLKDNKLYIGFTSDLKRRFKEHNNGESKSTKSRKPFELLYYEAHKSERDARRRERYLKTDKGKSDLKQMIREFSNV